MALDIKISFSWINYCRLCLQDKGLKIAIFEKESVSENIALKIEECLNISTYDGDPLPRMICHQCLCKLNTAYELHQKAMESFKLLLTHLQPLKHVPSVHEYMKDCQLALKNDEANNDTPVESISSKTTARRTSGNLSGTADQVGHQEQEEHHDQVRGRVTRSRVGGKPSLSPQDTGTPTKGRITIVPNIDNPSLTSSAKELPSTSAACGKESVFLVPFPPKPKLQDIHYQTEVDFDGSEDFSKRKRKRITDHYDEALMDTGGNLVLAAGRTRESRHREGKRKKIGPASRTRAVATCLTVPSPWQCVLCSCFFASHNMLRRHLSNCLICQTCGLEFSSAKDKAVHEEDHMYVNLSPTVDLLYKCNKCDRAFAAHLMLKMHVKYDHPEYSVQAYGDPHQPSPYVDPASPEDNVDVGDGDSCKCESDEDRKPDVAEERIVEGHEICPKCARPFVTKQRLAYHLLGHENLIKCSFCPWMFPVGPGRRRHQRRMHGDKADPVCFTCSVCKETFETKSILYLHKKSHDKNELLEDANKAEGSSKKTELEHCHVCDKMIQPSKFMAHLLHHANDAYDDKSEGKAHEADTLECPICHVTSSTQEQHRAHIAHKHVQKTSSFMCDGCGQVFANVEAINRHSCPGKETEKKWKNCKHCGQNLSDDGVHVCDNECPICHKIFKSARGQRLHIQHKHENPDSFSISADDQANSETRSSEDSGNPEPGTFERVSVKEEKDDVEDMEEETTEQGTAAPATDQDSIRTLPNAAEQPTGTAEATTITIEDTPTTTSQAVSDEPSSTSSNPSAEIPSVIQDPAHANFPPEKAGNVKGTPKIRLRPSGALISDPPPLASVKSDPSTNPLVPVFVGKPPPPYRPPIAPLNSILLEPKVTQNILFKRNNGPGEVYKLVVTNITTSTTSSGTNMRPAISLAGNNVPLHRVDHSYSPNFVPAPNVAPFAKPPLAKPPLAKLPSNPQSLTLGVGTPVSSASMASSFVTTVGPPAFIPLTNSSQIAPKNIISAPNVSFSQPITLNPSPSVIMNPKTTMCEPRPSILPQAQRVGTALPPLNPLNQNNSIRCVQIASLQNTPSSGAHPQISNQSNVDHGYGKLFNAVPPPAPPTVFNPLQPSSGAGDREENLLRDVLLGRRLHEDFI